MVVIKILDAAHTWALHRFEIAAISSHSAISWPLSCFGCTETSIRTGPGVRARCLGSWFAGFSFFFFLLAAAKPSLAGRLKEAARLYSDDKKPGRGEGDGKEENAGGGRVT